MKRIHRLVNCWRSGAPRAVAAAAMLALSATLLSAAEAKPKEETQSEKKPEKKKKLTGSELYAMHCNRCHPERYPTERTAAQWKTLMTHMRVRANLPSVQAKEILKYLQEDSGK